MLLGLVYMLAKKGLTAGSRKYLKAVQLKKLEDIVHKWYVQRCYVSVNIRSVSLYSAAIFA